MDRLKGLVWRVPVWVWLLISAVGALAIPRIYHEASLPEIWVFTETRADALALMPWQSAFAGFFLGASLLRWCGQQKHDRET
jgi:hypothetical protein